MERKTQFIAFNALFLLLVALSAVSASAQHTHSHVEEVAWKKGMLRITDSVWAGDVRLGSGMYHVKHAVEGDKHWVVFTSVTLGAGYREGSMSEGQEVVRLECRVEPAEKSLSNTKVGFGRKVAGKKSIQEIQIAGEKVKHIVLAKPSGVLKVEASNE